MNMSSNENIQEIIIRHLNDETTIAEQEVLQQWLKDPAQRSEFETLHRLWKDSAVAALHPFDTQKAWQKVNAGIILVNKSKVVPIFPLRKIMAVAASVLIIVSAGFFYYNFSKTEWKDIMAQSSNKNIQLSDGTVITLRKGSNLRIPDNYGKRSRHVQLRGEAYFQVPHDEQHPFYITTDKSIIQDLGTTFLVQSNDSIEQVMVSEGKVSFSATTNKDKVLILQAGETAILKEQKPERKLEKSNNLLAWKTNLLVFNNTALPQVAKDIMDYYDVRVQLSNDLQANQILVTARFNDEPLENVIEELHLFTGLNFRRQGNIVFVSK